MSTLARFEFLPDPNENTFENSKTVNLLDANEPPPLPSIPDDYFLLVKGFGSGHGVGMSQWGANGLAVKGKKFRQILLHYYSDVKIRSY